MLGMRGPGRLLRLWWRGEREKSPRGLFRDLRGTGLVGGGSGEERGMFTPVTAGDEVDGIGHGQ